MVLYMNSVKLSIIYAVRILRGEWLKYLLPFFSLMLSAAVITLVLALSSSASDYLQTKNKELIGGDLAIESNFRLNDLLNDQLSQLNTFQRTNELRFTGTLRSATRNTPVSFRVVDSAFPLIGTLSLRDGLHYTPPTEQEILLDSAAAQRLGVDVGDTVFLGKTELTLTGIVTEEPDSLLGALQLYPRAFLHHSGLSSTGLDTSLLKATHRVAILFSSLPDAAQSQAIETFAQSAKEQGYTVKFAQQTEGRSQLQLTITRQFLVITTLLTLLLTIINVYISTQFLLKRMQHTFTILQVLGIRRRFLSALLTLTLCSLSLIASISGVLIGYGLAFALLRQILQQFQFDLPLVITPTQGILVSLLILAATLTAFLPSWLRTLSQSPRAMLTGEEHQPTFSQQGQRIGLALATLIPFWWIAAIALESYLKSTLTLVALVTLYGVISVAYRIGIAFLYRYRHRTPFAVKTIIAQKQYDGLFGAVSFTSLFLALAALTTLNLTHTSLVEFFDADLSDTLPSTYLVDVQASQTETLKHSFPKLTLFPNVRARILSIDGTQIQDAIAAEDPTVNRELGREYNINYRTDLLDYETVVAGNWTPDQTGTFSVERNFGERVGIKMGSQIELLIQGFPIKGTVTSLRDTNQRSGLPFFFILGTPKDFQHFPATWFGYAHYTPERHAELTQFAAKNFPNVSVIDTYKVSQQIERLIQLLVMITMLVVLPTLVLACLLIVALILLSYGDRRRDGARLLAIGAKQRFIKRLYLFESLSTTLLALVTAYTLSLLTSVIIVRYLLDIPATTLFSTSLALLFTGLLASIALLTRLMWLLDKQPLQQMLTYENNR